MKIIAWFLWLTPLIGLAQAADSLHTDKGSPVFVGLSFATTIDKTSESEAHAAYGQTVVGWAFHRSMGAGVGIGIHDAYFSFEQLQYMPLFAHFRAKTPGKFGFVGFVNTGYDFALRKDESDEFSQREYEGGWLWHFGAGFRFRVKESDLHLTINHRSFESTITHKNIWQGEVTFLSEEKRRFNRIELMLTLEI